VVQTVYPYPSARYDAEKPATGFPVSRETLRVAKLTPKAGQSESERLTD
jgi:hypothetical protein